MADSLEDSLEFSSTSNGRTVWTQARSAAVQCEFSEMERLLKAPARHFVAAAELAADVDVGDVDMEEASRKRARIEARRKFRIVTRTILAAGRFRFVLDVEAEEPEQAESEIIAAFETMEVQSKSKESVDGSITRNRRLSYPQADGVLISEPGSINTSSFPMASHGYPPTGLGDGTAVSGQLFGEAEEYRLSLDEWSKEGEEWSVLDMLKEPEERPFDEPLEDSLYSPTRLVWEGDNEMAQLPETSLSDSQMSDYLITLDSQAAKEKEISGDWMDSVPSEDGMNSGQYEQEQQENSEGCLQNLWKIEEECEEWRTFGTELNNMITQKIQDLESGSGRAKVHKLVEDAEEIATKIGTASEVNRFRNRDDKATTSTIRTIKEAEEYLADIFDKLQAHVNDLSQNVQGRQRQATTLASMTRLIQNGRKAVQIVGKYTNIISKKLDVLVKDLKFRELILEKHLNKCAASITTLVQSALEKQKTNFVAVASVKKWYSENLQDLSSPTDLYKFLPVL